MNHHQHYHHAANDDDSATTFGQDTIKSDYRSVNLLEDDDDDDDDDDKNDNNKNSSKLQNENKSPVPSKMGSTAPNSSGRIKSPFISPATQTLNILSQNMDDLRYNMSNSITRNDDNDDDDDSESSLETIGQKRKQPDKQTVQKLTRRKKPSRGQEKTSTTSTTTTTTTTTSRKGGNGTRSTRTIPTVDDDDELEHEQGSDNNNNNKSSTSVQKSKHQIPRDVLLDRWEVIPIHIGSRQRQLGLAIIKSTFPEKTSGDHCRVKSIAKGSLAEKGGIRPDDWICEWGDNHDSSSSSSSSGAVTMLDYSMVRETASRRPFQVQVLRRKKVKQQQQQQQSILDTAGSKKKNGGGGGEQKPSSDGAAITKPPTKNDDFLSQPRTPPSKKSTPANASISELLKAAEALGDDAAASHSDDDSKMRGITRDSKGPGASKEANVQVASSFVNRSKDILAKEARAASDDSSDESSSGEDATKNVPKRQKEQQPKSKQKKTFRDDVQTQSSRTSAVATRNQPRRNTKKQAAPVPSKSKQPSINSSKKKKENGSKTKANSTTTTTTTTTTTNKSRSNKPNFCHRCNVSTSAAKRPRMHHAWCHLNPFFDNSGAMDLMERIRQGRKLNCPACEQEFVTGKPVPIHNNKKKNTRRKTTTVRHNTACLQNQKILKKQVEERERREEEEEQQKKKKKQAQDRKRKKSDQKQTQAPPAIASESSSEEEDDDDDDDEQDEASVYRPPKRGSKYSGNGASSSSVMPHSGKTWTAPTPAPKNSRDQPPSQVTPAQPQLVSDKRTDEARAAGAKPAWTSTGENPWGGAGYASGDVLLYGPLKGFGHVETIISSPRYIVDPFAPSSNYRTTHVTPREGLSVLSLRRDSLASQPWGFQLGRDEFGQACLVKSVDPLSPAASATLLGMAGDPSPAGITVNDMVLLVNGKAVGGMTVAALDVEIEASGPTILLTVSRYKHARDAARKYAAMEQQILDVMDSATRDRRLLGWMEVGHGVQEAPDFNNSTWDDEGNNDSQDDAVHLDDSDNDCPGGDDGIGDNNMHNNIVDEMENAPIDSREVEHEISSPLQERCDSPTPTQQGNDPDSPPSLKQPQSQASSPISCKSQTSAPISSPQGSVLKQGEDSASEDWEDDENAWLGCVCGRVHSRSGPDAVFWIQCDTCQSWYDVSKKCVGFGMEEAERIKRWSCWACPPQSESSMEPERLVRESTECDMKNPVETIQTQSEAPSPTASMVDRDRAEDTVESIESQINTAVSAYLAKKHAEQGNGKESPVSTRTCPQGKDDSNSPVESTARHGDRKRDIAASVSSETSQVLDDVEVQGKSEHTRHPKKRKLEWPVDRNQDKLDRTTTIEGFIIPRVLPQRRSDGTYCRPPGRPFAKMIWDEEQGLWKPKSLRSQKGTKRASEAKDVNHVPESYGEASSLHSVRQSTRVHRCESSDEKSVSRPPEITIRFEKGDLVSVEPYPRFGKNCHGGVGHILGFRYDEDGDRLYRVKYILGGTDKDIDEEHVKPYSFSTT